MFANPPFISFAKIWGFLAQIIVHRFVRSIRIRRAETKSSIDKENETKNYLKLGKRNFVAKQIFKWPKLEENF